MRKYGKFPRALALLLAVGAMAFSLPPAASAGPTQRSTYEIQFSTEPDPCSGEVLYGTAVIKEIIHITENANGYHQVNQMVIDGTAFGEISGTQYEFHEVYLNEFNYQNRSECQIEQTVPITFRYIAKGSADNWTVKALYHTTVGLECNVPSYIDSVRADCKG